MKKIMFNDKYGLTQAVLEGRKNMTRRLAYKELFEDENGYLCWTGKFKPSAYKPGDVVAVAQSYEAAGISFISPPDLQWGCTRDMHGFGNKMFVRADLMPHQIRITNVRLERLQDISDDDCLREGIIKMTFDTFSFDSWKFFTHNPREAFAALIDKVSGKGTWNSNPFVFVYEFELVK